MSKFTLIPKFDDTRVVAAHGVSTIDIDPDQPDKDIANMKQLFDGTITVRREFDNQFNDVTRSSNLTQEGKRERIVELATGVLDSLRGENLIELAELHHVQLLDSIRFKPATLDVRQFERSARPELSAVTAAAKHTALAVREHEVRQWLFTQDDLKRREVFNKAVDTRDELLFGAFVNAPAPMRDVLLAPDALKQGLQQWETNGSPAATKKVKALGRAIDLVKEARRGLVAHVRAVANLPESFKPVVVGRG